MDNDTLRYLTMTYIDSFRERLSFELVDGRWQAPPALPPRGMIRGLYDDIHDLYETHFEAAAHQLHRDGKTIIQGVGYGLIDDFRLFINIGLLYSNRLVLWDYAWGRLLPSATSDDASYRHLCDVVTNLLSIRELVASDGVCLLPHPTQWSEHTRLCLSELEQKRDVFSSANFGLVSALSVSDALRLHPYTLYPSEREVPRVSAGGDNYLTQGKLAFMHNLTTLAGGEPFACIKDISPAVLHKFLKESPDFFHEFREAFVIEGYGKSEAERLQAFNRRKDGVLKSLARRNNLLKIKKKESLAEGIIHLAALASIIYGFSTGGAINGAVYAMIASLSARLAKHVADVSKRAEENTLVLGFSQLQELAANNSVEGTGDPPTVHQSPHR